MTDDQEPDDYATGTVSLEVGSKEVHGEEVPTMDISIQVPEQVVESARESARRQVNQDVPEDAPEFVVDHDPQDFPDVFLDHLNERLHWQYENMDLPGHRDDE